MIVVVIVERIEAGADTGNDIGVKIVDIDRVRGHELKFVECDLVYFRLWFFRLSGVGVDAILEVGEHGE